MKQAILVFLAIFTLSVPTWAKNTRANCGKKMRAHASYYCNTAVQLSLFVKLGRSRAAVKNHIRKKMKATCARHCTGTGIPCNKNYNSCPALKAALSRISYDEDDFTEETEEQIDFLFLENIEKQSQSREI